MQLGSTNDRLTTTSTMLDLLIARDVMTTRFGIGRRPVDYYTVLSVHTLQRTGMRNRHDRP
jgi:hypothetical protein